ncbi:MAG: tRNA (N6-isopentenyl adenosine(37)-C2)-methylthiotransferase MiaB [Lachnospiraceae bacterium]|nr:tRNA (N6-isopentenyl adenosine(37)-C2)-methylthiotransferase MiaB [Lachnospiraceae bacterium]
MQAYVADKSLTMRRPLTACIVTFGCQMNARDSEKLAGVLKACGFVLQDDENADFVLYNTCTVRDNADQHVYGRLGRLHEYRRSNSFMKVALCGCMMQQSSCVEKIRRSYPFVSLIFGTYNIYCLPEYLWEVYHSRKRVIEIWDGSEQTSDALPAERKFSFKSGVNIMYGCNNFCSYCIVPYVRGRERSREPEDILREVRRLAASGVKEIMLLGQNVNSYGKTLEHPLTFAQLLEEVCAIDGIERIRFMSSHPKDLSDELIDTIARNPKVARHIHLALQSGSDRILTAMNRHYTKAHFLDLAGRIRGCIPDVAITTDIIAGFPGETAEDVDETIDVIEKVKFENAYTFIYSVRSGTPAAKMVQLPEEVKKENFDRILSAVQASSKERALALQGRCFEALAESLDEQQPGYVTGRLSDNMIVHFRGDASMIGHFYQVRLDECRGFYYFGTVINGQESAE